MLITTGAHFVLIDCSVRQSTPAGKARSEDPLRKAIFLYEVSLKTCPRKATACSGNQHGSYDRVYGISNKIDETPVGTANVFDGMSNRNPTG